MIYSIIILIHPHCAIFYNRATVQYVTIPISLINSWPLTLGYRCCPKRFITRKARQFDKAHATRRSICEPSGQRRFVKCAGDDLLTKIYQEFGGLWGSRFVYQQV